MKTRSNLDDLGMGHEMLAALLGHAFEVVEVVRGGVDQGFSEIGRNAPGLPAPFGLFGYPFELAAGSVTLLPVSTLWAIYGLVALTARFNKTDRLRGCAGIPATPCRNPRRVSP